MKLFRKFVSQRLRKNIIFKIQLFPQSIEMFLFHFQLTMLMSKLFVLTLEQPPAFLFSFVLRFVRTRAKRKVWCQLWSVPLFISPPHSLSLSTNSATNYLTWKVGCLYTMLFSLSVVVNPVYLTLGAQIDHFTQEIIIWSSFRDSSFSLTMITGRRQTNPHDKIWKHHAGGNIGTQLPIYTWRVCLGMLQCLCRVPH